MIPSWDLQCIRLHPKHRLYAAAFWKQKRWIGYQTLCKYVNKYSMRRCVVYLFGLFSRTQESCRPLQRCNLDQGHKLWLTTHLLCCAGSCMLTIQILTPFLERSWNSKMNKIGTGKSSGISLENFWFRKRSGNRSRRKFVCEKNLQTGLGENLVPKKFQNRSQSDFWVLSHTGFRQTRPKCILSAKICNVQNYAMCRTGQIMQCINACNIAVFRCASISWKGCGGYWVTNFSSHIVIRANRLT